MMGNRACRNRAGPCSDTAARNWKGKDRRTASRRLCHSPTGLSHAGSCGPAHRNLLRITLMRNKHPRMKLSPDEERFLRHWMYEEVHFREGTGPAKRLQVEHRIPPADL